MQQVKQAVCSWLRACFYCLLLLQLPLTAYEPCLEGDQKPHGSQAEQTADLHFNGITLFQRPVKDTRSVNDLPSEILVVCVPNEERLGGEGIGLDIHICSGDTCKHQIVCQRSYTAIWLLQA